MQFTQPHMRCIKYCIRGFDSREISEAYLVTEYRFIKPYIEQIISINWKVTLIDKCAKEILTGILETQFEYCECRDMQKDFNDLKPFLIQCFKTILCNINAITGISVKIDFDADQLTCRILEDMLEKSS